MRFWYQWMTFSFLILGGILDLNAQAAKLIDGFVNPTDMVAKGNAMYVCDYKTGKIHAFKLGIPNPVLSEVAKGFGGPFGMAIYQDYLYVAEYDSSQVSRIDLNLPNPKKQVIWKVQGISDLECFKDTLFAVNFDFNRLEYAVLSNINPTLKTFASAKGPFRINIKDSLVYISETSESRVSTINRYSNNPVAIPLAQPLTNPTGVAVYKNSLFIAENGAGKISSIDLLNPSKAKQTRALNLNGPDAIKVYNGTLYIGEFDEGQISHLLLDSTANVKAASGAKYQLLPNPCTSHISILGTAKTTWVCIYSKDGKRVFNKAVPPNEQIPLTNLPSGVYLISIEHKKGIPFVKN